MIFIKITPFQKNLMGGGGGYLTLRLWVIQVLIFRPFFDPPPPKKKKKKTRA